MSTRKIRETKQHIFVFLGGESNFSVGKIETRFVTKDYMNTKETVKKTMKNALVTHRNETDPNFKIERNATII